MYIKSFHDYNIEINSLRETIEEVKAGLDGLQGINYTKGLSTGGVVSTDNGLTAKIQWILKQEEKLQALMDSKIDLANRIELLPFPSWRAICRYKLVKGYTFERISEIMRCSRMDVYRKYKKALKELKK